MLTVAKLRNILSNDTFVLHKTQFDPKHTKDTFFWGLLFAMFAPPLERL